MRIKNRSLAIVISLDVFAEQGFHLQVMPCFEENGCIGERYAFQGMPYE
jgi:hypothetical protein